MDPKRDDVKISFYVAEGRDGRFYPVINTCTPLDPHQDGHYIGPARESFELAETDAARFEARAMHFLGPRLTKRVTYPWSTD